MTPLEFRARAKECELQALLSKDGDIRRTYEELARQWRELADQIERHGLA